MDGFGFLCSLPLTYLDVSNVLWGPRMPEAFAPPTRTWETLRLTQPHPVPVPLLDALLAPYVEDGDGSLLRCLALSTWSEEAALSRLLGLRSLHRLELTGTDVTPNPAVLVDDRHAPLLPRLQHLSLSRNPPRNPRRVTERSAEETIAGHALFLSAYAAQLRSLTLLSVLVTTSCAPIVQAAFACTALRRLKVHNLPLCCRATVSPPTSLRCGGR